MIILRGPASIQNITDPGIKSLANLRFSQICGGEYDYDSHGYMIVVEPGDGVGALEKETGCPILSNFFDGTRYGDPDFTPSYEALEEHASCYEMVFILSDGGFGIELFIPKRQGIDAELLAMCAEYSVPTFSTTSGGDHAKAFK